MLLACAAVPAGAQVTGGITPTDALLSAKPATLGAAVRFEGMLAGSGPGRRVDIQLRSSDGSWRTIARGPVAANGAFKLSWKATKRGRFLARALASGGRKAEQSNHPTTIISVHSKTQATWYDQSGTTTACGVRLKKKTLGVAHKTLRCGTLLEFSFRGRSITVPVIDRGPYGAGISYDFTIEVARRLGFVNTGRGSVGVLAHSNALTAFGGPSLPGTRASDN